MTHSSSDITTPPAPLEESGALSLGDCPNCGARLHGPFCAQCGEKKLHRHDYTLREVAGDVVGEFTHLDGRLLRTLITLVRRPGELSRAYFHGGRSRYTKPLTLFVIINIVFFILQPHTGLLGYRYSEYLDRGSESGAAHVEMVRAKLARTGESETSYAARFNAVLQDQKKSMLIFSIPVLALAMLILFAGTGRTFVEHLVFSVHVYTFALLYVFAVAITVSLIALPLYNAGLTRLASRVAGDAGITVFMLTGLTAYMYFGFRRVYGVRGFMVLLRAFALAWTVGFLTGTYRDVVFYATFWST